MRAEAYEIYIDGWQVPITPAELDMSVGSKNEFLDLINGNTYTAIKKRELKEFSFSFYSFSHPHPSVGNFISQSQVIKNLEDLKNKKKVFEFVIIRTSSDPELKNSTCKYTTLEDYKIHEDTDYGTNIKIDVTLKEYIPLKTVKIKNAGDSEEHGKRKIYREIKDNANKAVLSMAMTGVFLAMPSKAKAIATSLMTPKLKNKLEKGINDEYRKFKKSIFR